MERHTVGISSVINQYIDRLQACGNEGNRADAPDHTYIEGQGVRISGGNCAVSSSVFLPAACKRMSGGEGLAESASAVRPANARRCAGNSAIIIGDLQFGHYGHFYS